MRKSAKIAVGAHRRAMGCIVPGMYEYEVEAEYMHEFRRHDAANSYIPIVGTGANACTLHYIDNTARLADGDLLLVDAGCEYDYYASDVTRTFPVGALANQLRQRSLQQPDFFEALTDDPYRRVVRIIPVVAYMGLFDRCELRLEDDLIDRPLLWRKFAVDRKSSRDIRCVIVVLAARIDQ